NIVYFRRSDEPLNVSIVVPTPRQGDANYFQSVREAIRAFKQRSHEKNRYSIVTDSIGSQFLGNLETDGDAVLDGFSIITAGQQKGTIFDLCAVAHSKLKGDPDSVILSIDRGDETTSQFTYSDLREQIRRLNVPVYSVSLDDRKTKETVQEALTRL